MHITPIILTSVADVLNDSQLHRLSVGKFCLLEEIATSITQGFGQKPHVVVLADSELAAYASTCGLFESALVVKDRSDVFSSRWSLAHHIAIQLDPVAPSAFFSSDVWLSAECCAKLKEAASTLSEDMWACAAVEESERTGTQTSLFRLTDTSVALDAFAVCSNNMLARAAHTAKSWNLSECSVPEILACAFDDQPVVVNVPQNKWLSLSTSEDRSRVNSIVSTAGLTPSRQQARLNRWVAVDLDSTLAVDDRSNRRPGHIGEPLRHVCDFVRELLDRGVTVKVFTARCSNTDTLEAAIEVMAISNWTRNVFGVQLEVTSSKDLGCVFVLDDISCHPETLQSHADSVLERICSRLQT